MMKIGIGQRVYWNDPDEDSGCSGWGEVVALQHDPPDEDSVISLKMEDEGEVECLICELSEDEPDEPGTDLCDLCMSSEVNVDRTTWCGKTIGIECGCEEDCDGTCGDDDCEDCRKGKEEEDQ